MYKIVFVFIGCLLVLSCREPQKASPFFEGYVEYDLKTEVFDTLEDTRQMEKLKGKKMVCYFKDGYYLREYYGENSVVVSKQVYSPKRNDFHIIFTNGPIYQMPATNDSLKIKNIQVYDGESKTILGYQCPSMISTAEYKEKTGSSIGLGQLFFCKNLLLDSSLFKGISAGGYNTMISKYPHVAIGIVEESKEHYKDTYTATKIVHKKLKGGFFSVPDGEIIKL